MIKIKNHPLMSFKLVNNTVGWLTFIIASVTYLLTVEPTASLWDCGEFITTSAGLQICHPPGAPLFMLLARLFSIFAPNPTKIALMVNSMSALASGATIMFLFWTITHLARKIIIVNKKECSITQLVAIMGSGIIGALAYTYSDTFWFSAVEGEVYALSSLFTALVFWAILKWEDIADEPYANRWIILIAYLMGLSIGVHLLNLLAIPAIVFIYYFKKFKTTRTGIVKTGIISLIILGFTNFILIPGVIKIAGWFELIFVNGMGFPFNTGVIVYLLLLIFGLAYGIYYTIKKNHTLFNTILTCLIVILIGYSSYSIIVIRSIANPPIDENSPDNVFSLLSYIERDQYGQSPLIYGQYYNAQLVSIEDGEPIYYQNSETKKYEQIGNKPIYKYDPRFCGIFPRMYSNSRPYFESQYSAWGGTPNGTIYDVNGKSVQKPSFGNNLRYFFNYQLNFMYWRYFMWNFSGRQSDVQGYGNIRDGNWITGIKFLDALRLGNQDYITDDMKSEKSRNKYFLLPFLLGLFGLIHQYKQGKEGKEKFWTIMLLFIFTGIAIIVFLNQTPMEPRERDYAYAGSFYAFSIWIGLGLLYVNKLFAKYINPKYGNTIAFSLCLITVPINMAIQNWDDHDRSGRYATEAHAKNYLESCAPNAILFTYGDNDTFPLWYVQEVEGIRRDIRIVNLSLLSGDWYIDQMKRKVYETAPVPLSMNKKQYHAGVRDQVVIENLFKSANAQEAVGFVLSDDSRTKTTSYTEKFDFIPTRHILFPIDSTKAIANGSISPEDANRIVKNVEITLSGNHLNKSQLALLDIIATNDWKRPIYFGIGMGKDSYMGFEKYFRLEGAAYRVIPIKSKANEEENGQFGEINTDILYNNMMNKFVWGNIKDPKVNMDYFHDNTVGVIKYRTTFLRLANKLFEEGKKEKAIKTLDKSLTELPIYQIPVSNTLINYISMYYKLGSKDKANKLGEKIFTKNLQILNYCNSLSNSLVSSQDIQREANISMRVINLVLSIMNNYGETKKSTELSNKIKAIYGDIK